MGTLLILASGGNGTSIEIIRYLVEEKNADVNILGNSGYSPLMHAITNNRFDIALYLLNNGADIKQCSVLARACTCGPSNSPISVEQLILIRTLLMRGDRFCHSYRNESDLERDYGISLKQMRRDLCLEYHWMTIVNDTMVDITVLLCDNVLNLIDTKGVQAFYLPESIIPPVEIDEDKLAVLITQLEKRGRPLDYLVCGLLLEGHIQNFIPDRYTEIDENYQNYLIKRKEDASVFYTKASTDKSLKKVADILLWQLKVYSSDALQTRLNQYDISPPEELGFMETYCLFERDFVTMPSIARRGLF